jgi:glucose dehydrogenase
MKPVRISVLILFACFVSLAWGQQPGKRWSQFHRHNMERWNPYDKVLSVQNVGGLGLKWSYATGSDVDSSPAIANGVVYVGSWDDKVYALGAGTGALLWSYTTGNVVTSSPAVANGVVYVGSDDDNVYALNARTGTLLWSYATGSLVESSPAVANGVVYVGSDDVHMYAFGLKKKKAGCGRQGELKTMASVADILEREPTYDQRMAEAGESRTRADRDSTK